MARDQAEAVVMGEDIAVRLTSEEFISMGKRHV